jgi:sugar O-acyltransferase (sialic acid O-acetyltransferase NeuD family)
MGSAGAAPQGTDPDRPVTARPIVVLGGGGHARVVIEAARSCPTEWEVIGVVDPSPAPGAVSDLGVAYLGDDETFAAQPRSLDTRGTRPWLVVGVGGIDPRPRKALVTRHRRSSEWATIVHATAWVSPTAELAAGAVVLAGATVNAGARIGSHAIVNTGAIVEHDVVIDAFGQVAPGAVIGGGTSVGEGAFIGLGARVRDHVTIGESAVVGMGAVVVGDVAPGTTVAGDPARARETAGA